MVTRKPNLPGLALAATLLCSCYDFEQPEEAQIGCSEADPWCPAGYRCATGVGRCLPEGADDIEPPEASLRVQRLNEPELSTVHLKSGVVLVVHLHASEPLLPSPPPKLEIEASDGLRFEMALAESANNTDFEYRFTVGLGQDVRPAEGPAVLLATSMIDAAGNLAPPLREPAKVFFDYTPPQVQDGTVDPKRARVGSRIRASVNMEDVTEAQLVSDGDHTLDLVNSSAGLHIFEYTVTAQDTDGTFALYLEATDLAGNATNRQAPSGRTGLELNIDVTPPTVSNVDVAEGPYSAARSSRDVELTFDCPDNLNDNLDQSTAYLKVSIGGKPMGCELYSPSLPNYRCTYRVQAGDPTGEITIVIETRDSAGNTALNNEATIRFDLAPPRVVGSALLRTPAFAPAADGDIVHFSAADPFTGEPVTATLLVFADEPLDDDLAPALFVDGPGSLDFGAGISREEVAEFSFTFDPEDPPAEGDYHFLVVWRDRLGNQTGDPLEVPDLTLAVDDTPPPDGSLDAEQVLFRRVPWGSERHGADPYFAVIVPSEAIERDEVELLVAYRSTGEQMGAVFLDPVLDPDTDVVLDQLSAGDVNTVFLRAVDQSGVRSEPLEVRAVEWTATMGFKRAGSLFENPHRLELRPWFLDTLEQGGVSEGDADDGLGLPGHPPLLEVTGGGTWHQRRGSGDPAMRRRHAMVYDAARDRIVLFGGEWNWNLFFDDTWEWDGEDWNEVTPPGVSPPARFDHAMVHDLLRGRTVLFGGDTGERAADTWEWNGEDWIDRTPDTGGPPKRDQHSMAFDSGRGVTVLFGGCAAGFPSCVHALNDTWHWDGERWEDMQPPGQVPTERSAHAMAYDAARGEVVLFGGCTAGERTHCTVTSDETWIWSGETRTWAPANPTDPERDGNPAGRTGHSLVYHTGEQRVLLIGGCHAEVFPGLCARPDNAVWEWTGVSWRKRSDPALVPQPTPRRLHATVHDRVRERTVVFGGDDGIDHKNDTWEWDGDSWEQRGPTDPDGDGEPPRRMGYGMVYDEQHRHAVMYGGCYHDVDYQIYGDTWLWDGIGWTGLITDSELEGDPDPRCLHAMASSGPGRALLFGGCIQGKYPTCDPAGYSDETWEWTGEEWVLHEQPGGGPSARFGHAMTRDTVRDEVVLFGGCTDSANDQYCTNGMSNETWIFNGAGWEDRTPAVSPAPRFNASMAFDEVRGLTVMVGGASTQGCGDEGSQTLYCPMTWEWDGAAWTRRDDLIDPEGDGNPSERHSHSLTYDRARERVVLFGGYSDGIDNESWEYDGQSWARRLPTDPEGDGYPAPQAGHRLTYDTARDRVILLGAGTERTWEWEGGEVARPGAVFKVSFRAAEKPADDPDDDPDFTSLRARIITGGEGHTDGARKTGARLLVWDEGQWQQVDTNASESAFPTELAFSASGNEAIERLLFGDERQFNFAVTPVESNGSGTGKVSVDYVEAVVEYRRPEPTGP